MKNLSQKHSAPYALVLDVGTTGVKALVFDKNFSVVARSYALLNKQFPLCSTSRNDCKCVEQDPCELITRSAEVLRHVLHTTHIPHKAWAGFGITTQRETFVCWDAHTGNPIYPAIVWEDTRTSRICASLNKKHYASVKEKTGLSIDPYFSASKIKWVLDNVPAAQTLLSQNRLACGTVDSWILRSFADKNPHTTDYTNASRTLLFNIRTLSWDNALLEIFDIPESILPRALPSSSRFGALDKKILGFSLPILAMCGDQQASLYAAGTALGTTKVTYGTGTFLMQTLGKKMITSSSFFTTLTADSKKNAPRYAAEIKIACCGQKIQAALANPPEMYGIMNGLAHTVAKKLPLFPMPAKKLILDGGATQSPYLVAIQSTLAHLPTKKQPTHDGTALGIAKLILKNA
ncbi:MAG: FGGY family carbohydrate kinase [Patescibacteria group bacterium]|nr:FGGY family carbohydrate kinase [Patescibacteria group bacterium]